MATIGWTALAEIHATDYKSLVAYYRRLPEAARMLIGDYHVDRMTRAQHRRLPKAIRRCLHVAKWV